MNQGYKKINNNYTSHLQFPTSNCRGITLMVLVITIVLLLILASVTIGAINGGLFNYAGDAKRKAEISDLVKRIAEYQIINDTTIERGSINDILGIESQYNDKLEIENGKLVYKGDWSDNEKAELEEMNINQATFDIYNNNKNTIYYIANEDTVEKYSDLTNIGTLAQFRSLANGDNFPYDEARLIEDIKLNEGKYTITNGEITFTQDATQWAVITSAFEKPLDGQGHTISGLKGLYGLFSNLSPTAKIKNLGIINSRFEGTDTVGAFAKVAYGTIENCWNEAIVNSSNGNGSIFVGGLVGMLSYDGKNGGVIRNSYNNMKITTTKYCRRNMWKFRNRNVNRKLLE